MALLAISVIHCHLRWQEGSPWHWPLTDTAFSRGRRIELGVTPLSDIGIYLGRTGGVQGKWMIVGFLLLLLLVYTGEGKRCGEAKPHFVSPMRRESGLLRFTLPAGPPSVCLPLFYSPRRFIPQLENQNTTCGADDLSCFWWTLCLVRGFRAVSFLFPFFQNMVYLALRARAVRLI